MWYLHLSNRFTQLFDNPIEVKFPQTTVLLLEQEGLYESCGYSLWGECTLVVREPLAGPEKCPFSWNFGFSGKQPGSFQEASRSISTCSRASRSALSGTSRSKNRFQNVEKLYLFRENDENFTAFKGELCGQNVASHHTGDLCREGFTSASRGKHGWRFTARIEVTRRAFPALRVIRLSGEIWLQLGCQKVG